MPLQRGKVLGYDFNRMVVDFTMFNQGKTVRCAISTAAMDDLEGKHEVKADQRVDQFLRLRDAIEERASRKFFERTVHAEGPEVLRSNDFFNYVVEFGNFGHCGVMPSCLMILPHLSASARVNVASSSGLDLAVSTAMSSIRFFTSGRTRIRPISALSLATISFDMPAGP